MAPLTRFRATDEHVPVPALAGTYYAQRASSLPGTLLVTEGTFISPTAGGFENVPGIYNAAQIAAWRQVTDAVHAKGGHIFVQLWSLGRAADESVATKEGFVVHSSSAVPIPDSPSAATPVAMTIPEIRTRIAEYATAAKNAIEAGFDGVEIHGANGYLVDQFTQDTSNQRTDEYGGSIENRSRFGVEVVQAVVDAIGAERTAIRLSPWSRFQGMRMQDPIPQFEDLIRKISVHGLAYLHLVQRRIDGSRDAPESTPVEGESLDFAVNLWNGPLLIAGSLSPNQAKSLVDEEYKNKNVLATFGRYFISTPDLPFRIKEGIPLNKYDRSTFYLPKSPVGYIDQPFSKEFEALHGAQSVKL
ncbi:NADH:flavin oxidoreductase [Dichotomopilus funicola]|uniref:NADH:flavin oxidoreductase n=1 Tax=Dichotomopilus funicola TaxID=1934379 RepID=A0AAN6ZPI9_9PEZI|nr:NADH:flavin oxidoreductase [Dichotomopilus funicola]